VLDALLADEAVTIDGLSGTSAGAMNAAVVAYGLQLGGRDAAREMLNEFWRAVSRRGCFSPYHGLSRWPPLRPVAIWLDAFSRMVSPYVANPLNIDPLREVLEDVIRFDQVHCCRKVKLFISATNVLTNRLRIFGNEEITPEVLLASACLPHLHHAVEVEGEWYWDGGFMGNPVLEPLIDRCDSNDILIVQINPTRRDHVPRSAEAILDRLNEITFNASLMREMRTVARVTAMVEAGELHSSHFDRTFFHLVHAESELSRYGAASKLDTSWSFLRRLKDLGHAKGVAWLAEHRADVGRRTTLDLDAWRTSDPAPCPGGASGSHA
jgi:NTE family protein